MTDTYQGGCFCGRVRYSATGPVKFAILCHCRDCQRASGAGHLPVMGVGRDGFTVTGEPGSFAAMGDSGQPVHRHFCKTCGGQLFGLPDAYPAMLMIYAGTLDDPARFVPTKSAYTATRQPWDTAGGQFQPD